MKITLSPQQTFSFAEVIASAIYGRVVEMQLWRTGNYEKKPSAEFDEACAAIRSIVDPFERKQFVWSVGWHFKRMRAERCMCPRWQDYVAAVEANQKAMAA